VIAVHIVGHKRDYYRNLAERVHRGGCLASRQKEAVELQSARAGLAFQTDRMRLSIGVSTG
jgi:hypothetical protein